MMSQSLKTLGLTHEAVTFGLLCVPVGVAIGLFVSRDANDGSLGYFAVFAALSAFLVSTFLWWLLIQRTNKRTNRRAVTVGILTGLLSHWLCWYLMLLWSNVDFWLLGGTGSSLGEAPMNPLFGIAGVLALCLWSWALFAWVTVGAGIGIALVWLWAGRATFGSGR